MLYVPSFCVSTLQSTQFMSIPFRVADRKNNKGREGREKVKIENRKKNPELFKGRAGSGWRGAQA